tara:strand:- start:351 stop:563 length:213 start_codon:yes stop_codon:yes gene_type:complete
MPKVSQELSFTVNLGNYNSAKATVGIYDLDTDHDVEEQLEIANKVLGKAFVKLYKLADAEVEKILQEAGE